MLLAGGEGRRLSPLTSKLAKPAVPFGGHYRIIDFPLSNCVNSGIDTIGVLTQYEPESLHKHIGDGSPWKLPQSDTGGISLLPAYNTGVSEYAGTADAIYKNMDYVDGYNPENVLILSGDHIYHMDYRDMLQFHVTSQANATISVMSVPWEEAHRFGVMSKDQHSRIIDFVEKPQEPSSNLVSMGIYLFNWNFLKKHLLEDAEDHNSDHDFGKNIIPKMLQQNETLHAYEFQGYWRDVGTVHSLWEAHMDLLTNDNGWNLISKQWPMYTRGHYPTYSRGIDQELLRNNMVHERCDLQGTVESSVIFGDTEIGRYSKIKDSVIMPNVKIGRNVLIERAIIGEGAYIKDGAIIRGTSNEIMVIGPYEIVTAKPTVLPQPTRILKEVYDNANRRLAEGFSS